MKTLPERFNSFEECILLDYWSENLCRDFVVLVDNIWADAKLMRSDLDEIEPVFIRMVNCQRIEIVNCFSDTILASPTVVNWGISEFSLIQMGETEDGLIRVSILWEDERRVVVECQDVEIREEKLTPKLKAKYRLPYLNSKDSF